jgi:hypothetical protein
MMASTLIEAVYGKSLWIWLSGSIYITFVRFIHVFAWSGITGGRRNSRETRSGEGTLLKRRFWLDFATKNIPEDSVNKRLGRGGGVIFGPELESNANGPEPDVQEWSQLLERVLGPGTALKEKRLMILFKGKDL